MNSILRIITFALLLGVILPLRAAEVSGLYESEVPVTAQDTTQRQDAIRTALLDVLVKVTGNRNIANSPAVADIPNNAAQYVQQFLYRNAAPAPAVATGRNGAAAAPGRVLWVRFDEAALNRALRQRNVPVWGRARPAVLLWLALEEQGGRSIVGADNRPEWKQLVQSVANARGIPLTLPTLDADDQANLTSVDLWGDVSDDVVRVSARYPSDAIVIGRIATPSPGTYQGMWTLLEQKDRNSWSSQSDGRDSALIEGLQTALDAVADRYTQSEQGVAPTAPVLVRVRDVQSADDYARVLKYLSSLAAAERVSVVQIEKQNMVFRVDARGGAQRLTQDVRLGSTLVPVVDDKSVGADAERVYRLQR